MRFSLNLRGSVVSVWHVSSAPKRWSPVGGRETCSWLWCTPDHSRWPGRSSAPYYLHQPEEEWSPPPDGCPHSCLFHLTCLLYGCHSDCHLKSRKVDMLHDTYHVILKKKASKESLTFTLKEYMFRWFVVFMHIKWRVVIYQENAVACK